MNVRVAYVSSIACAALLAASGPAFADGGLAKAESHFNKASTLYKGGMYQEAADEFQAAYGARALPPFLFNVGAAYEKLAMKEPSKMEHWKQAISYYKKYLDKQSDAMDATEVKQRVKVLKAEVEYLKEAMAKAELPSEVKASDKVQQLPDIAIRGLVVIESDPSGAEVYLDNTTKGPMGKTPWSGSFKGVHTILVKRKGYRQHEVTVSPSTDQLLVLKVALAKEDTLGWVEITSNVPGADIYIDDKSMGAVAKTPHTGNLKPGKHTVWVTAEGFDEVVREIEVVAGETQSVKAKLKGSPVGYISVSGGGIELSTIYMDGKQLCKRGPCRRSVPQGRHRIEIKRNGYKSYRKTVDVQPRSELTLKVDLAKKPGRGDAVWAYVFSAAFAGGGVALSLQSQKLYDDLSEEVSAGGPPPDPNDPRFQRGQLFTIGADVAYGLAGVMFLTAVYYSFRDKGSPSKGALETRAMALEPQVGPGYAGLGMEVSW